MSDRGHIWGRPALDLQLHRGVFVLSVLDILNVIAQINEVTDKDIIIELYVWTILVSMCVLPRGSVILSWCLSFVVAIHILYLVNKIVIVCINVMSMGIFGNTWDILFYWNKFDY
jgi:hypothetical protein